MAEIKAAALQLSHYVKKPLVLMLKAAAQVPVCCCCTVNWEGCLTDKSFTFNIISDSSVAPLVLVVDCYGYKANETDCCAAGFLFNCVDKILIILTYWLLKYFYTYYSLFIRLFLAELDNSN